MRIICEKCKTEYSLDEERLSPTGSPVRCTQCGHVFKAVPPQKKKSTNTLTRTNKAVPWMLQHRSGETKKFIDTKKLQNYIADGKADGLDLVSRFGGPWKEIADTTELKGYLRSSHFPDPHPHGQGSAGSSSQTTRQPTMKGDAVFDDGATKKNQKDTLPPAATSPWTATIREGRPPRNSEEPTSRQKTVGSTSARRSTNPPTGMRTASSSLQATFGGMPPGKAKKGTAPLPKKDMKPAVKSSLPTIGGMPSSIPPGPEAQAAPKAAHAGTIPASQSIAPAGQSHTLKSSPPAGLGPAPATSTLSGIGQQTAAAVPGKPTAGDEGALAPTSVVTPPGTKALPSEKRPAGEISGELDFSSVPESADEQWTAGGKAVSDSEPGWTKSSSSVTPIPDGSSMYDSAPRKRGWVYVVLGAAAVLILGSAYLFIFQKDVLTSRFGKAQNDRIEERLAALLLEAREKVLLDTQADFAQAERIYQQILGIQANNTDALVQMAQMYTIWAERLQDNYLDTISEGATENEAGASPESLKKSYDTRIENAGQQIDRALSLAPDDPQANIVAAQIEILQGNIDEAKSFLEKGRAKSTLQDASYVTALIGIQENQNQAEIIGMLKSIVVAEPRLRVLYRLARVQLSDGQTEEANDSIARILKLNSKHTAALALQELATTGKSVALILPAETTSESDSDVEMEIEEDEVKTDAAALKTETSESTEADNDAVAPKPVLTAAALLRKAAAAQANGRSDDAMRLYTQVLEKDPSNIEAINGMGYVSLDLGSRGQAIARFKRALSINPGFGPSQIGMAQTYKFMGQKAEALKWFEKYLSNNPGGRHAGMARRNVDELKASTSSPAASQPATTDDDDVSSSTKVESGSEGEKPATVPENDKVSPVNADTGESTSPAPGNSSETKPSPPATPPTAPSPPAADEEPAKPAVSPKADTPAKPPAAPVEKAPQGPADEPAGAE